MKTPITVRVNGKSYEVGHMVDLLHSGLDYEIPKLQVVDHEAEVRMVGLQCIDFSEFLILLEVTTDSVEGGHFLLDSNEYKGYQEGTVFGLEPFEGGYEGFNKLVGSRLD
ncbi:hypothetical protein P9X10_01140 [Bacillus cereus]|nr:hypothetical protein [Bacillus cereus]